MGKLGLYHGCRCPGDLRCQDVSNHGINNCPYFQISSLSSEFYYLIPQKGYEYERLLPLDREHTINDHCENIRKLMELEYAGQVLLGAQYRHKGENFIKNVVAVAAYSRLASRSQAKFHTKKLSPLVRPCAAAPAQSTTSAYRSLRFSPR